MLGAGLGVGTAVGVDDVVVRLELPPHAASVGTARAIVGALADRAAPGWGDRVRLAVSELVTNAVVHASTPIEVRARWDGGSFRVEVHDQDPTTAPVDKLLSFDQIHGWGLTLVELSVGAWGYEVDGASKSVWFELTPSSGLWQ